MTRAFFFLAAIFLVIWGFALRTDLWVFLDLPSLLIVAGTGLVFTAGYHGYGPLVAALRASRSKGSLSRIQSRAHQHVLQSLRTLLCASAGLGLLIGLVHMLQNMSDPSAIGPAMAVALLTPVYGVIFAELVVAPMIRDLGLRTAPGEADSQDPIVDPGSPWARWLFHVAGIALILGGITMNGSIFHFIDSSSILVVLGGGTLLCLAHQGWGHLKVAWAAAKEGSALSPLEAQAHQRVLGTARNLILASGGLAQLIGLVTMFRHMDDPSRIGPAMAMALLSFFYALILAELILAPRIHQLGILGLKSGASSDVPATGPGPRTALLLGVVTATPLLAFFVLLLAMSSFMGQQKEASSTAGSATEEPAAYSGHGEGSVSPEILAKYAPPRVHASELERIERYLDIRSPSSGRVSPDGQSMFINWSVTGTTQVWRLSKDQAFPVQLTGGQDSSYLRGLLSDGKTLVVSRDKAGSEYYGLYLLDAQGGALRPIKMAKKVKVNLQWTARDPNVLYYSANDKNKADYTIYRYSIAEDRHEVVSEQPGYWFIADKQGDKLLLVKAKGNTSREVFLFDEKSQTLSPLFGQDEEEQYSVAFNAKGEVLALTNKFDDFKRLYVFRDKKFEPLTPTTNYEVSSFFTDRNKTRIHRRLVKEGRYSFDFMDMDGQPITGPSFEGATHTLLGKTSANDRYLSVGVTFHDRPRSSYVWDWQTRSLSKWTLPSAPEVDTRGFTRDERVFYPAEDGTPIPMFVKRGVNCVDQPIPCPVIIRFHGGPEGASYPGFSPYDEVFIEAGFVVAKPNVRGSSGLGKKWLHADNGPKRLQVITDIRDAALYVKKEWAREGVAPKVGIAGGSYGGYSALVGMTMFAGTYDAGMANVGMSDLVSFLKNTAPYRRKLRESEYGYLDKDMEALVALSPITHVHKLKDPLLLIHGANDPRVPAGESVQIAQVLEKKGVPVEVVLFPDEGHGVRKRKNRAISLATTLKFFQTHLDWFDPEKLDLPQPRGR